VISTEGGATSGIDAPKTSSSSWWLFCQPESQNWVWTWLQYPSNSFSRVSWTIL
jgi:hypothetical protein